MRTIVSLAIVAIVAFAPVSTGAWGMDVHRLITGRALDALPTELHPFYAARRDFVVEHSVDPDLWRIVDLRGERGPEEPNHFLDIDGLDEPRPFTGVPRDWDAYVARYGLKRITEMGRLPWRIEEIYRKLVTAFQEAGRPGSYGGDNARYLSAVLSHYIEDGHQPLHAVMNYDGQLTGQRGVHSRFETELVRRNLPVITWGAVVVTPIPDIKAFAFATLVDSESLAAGVLDADRRAADGRELYDDECYRRFFTGARPTLEKRLSDSVSGVASVIVAAWTEAGKPALPVGTVRPPARIVRP